MCRKLLNSEKLTDRWEALYGKLTWRGAWMKQWVEPTKQKLPPYHGPDVVPDLPRVRIRLADSCALYSLTRPALSIASMFP